MEISRDEFDQIFGGNGLCLHSFGHEILLISFEDSFLDLPAFYDEDDDNDDSFTRPSTPVISVNEKIESWLFDSSAGQDSNGPDSAD